MKNFSERSGGSLRMRSSRKGIFFLCMAAVLFSCGCGEFMPGITDPAAFERERQLWLEQDIQNYSFAATLKGPGGPRPSCTVFVQDGDVLYFWDNPTNMRSPGDFAWSATNRLFTFPTHITISEIYEEIERHADTGSIGVSYNTALHYPTCINIGWKEHDINHRTIYIDRFIVDPVLPGMEDRGAFENERRLWLEQGIQNYSFTAARGGSNGESGGGSAIIEEGRVKYYWDSPATIHTNTYLPGLSYGSWADLFAAPNMATITGIFEEIERYANFGSMEVLYDATFHYPRYVHWRPSLSTYKEIYINQFSTDPQFPAP